MIVELADTHAERPGTFYREPLADDEGMLFLLMKDSGILMKDMLFPIDII